MSNKANRAHRRAEIKRSKRAQKQRQRMQPPKGKRPTAAQRQRLAESLFYMHEERPLTPDEQTMMAAIIADLQTRMTRDEPWILRQWINAVCDLLPDGAEWHFWEQAEGIITIEQFEALPTPDVASMIEVYSDFVTDICSIYPLLGDV